MFYRILPQKKLPLLSSVPPESPLPLPLSLPSSLALPPSLSLTPVSRDCAIFLPRFSYPSTLYFGAVYCCDSGFSASWFKKSTTTAEVSLVFLSNSYFAKAQLSDILRRNFDKILAYISAPLPYTSALTPWFFYNLDKNNIKSCTSVQTMH